MSGPIPCRFLWMHVHTHCTRSTELKIQQRRITYRQKRFHSSTLLTEWYSVCFICLNINVCNLIIRFNIVVPIHLFMYFFIQWGYCEECSGMVIMVRIKNGRDAMLRPVYFINFIPEKKTRNKQASTESNIGSMCLNVCFYFSPEREIRKDRWTEDERENDKVRNREWERERETGSFCWNFASFWMVMLEES